MFLVKLLKNVIIMAATIVKCPRNHNCDCDSNCNKTMPNAIWPLTNTLYYWALPKWEIIYSIRDEMIWWNSLNWATCITNYEQVQNRKEDSTTMASTWQLLRKLRIEKVKCWGNRGRKKLLVSEMCSFSATSNSAIKCISSLFA